MLRSSTTIFSILAILALTVGVQAQEIEENGPRMVVPEKILDLGEVIQGEVVDANFKFLNEGNETLVIKAVRPTCGCTVAEFDREIAAGASGFVRSKLDTREFAGPIAKAIMVMTNDPQTASVNLTIKANVRPIVEILPRPLVSFNALQGEGAERTVVVVPVEKDPSFKVTKVESDADTITASIRQLEGEELLPNKATPQYEVAVAVKDDAPIGPVNSEINIFTTNPKAKTVPVKVFGVIRSVLQVSPTQIQFGTVQASTSPGQYVIVANNRQGGELAITGAEVDDAAFLAEVQTVAEGKRYRVAVSIKPDASPGPRDATLVLKTNDETLPTLSIPVRANIR